MREIKFRVWHREAKEMIPEPRHQSNCLRWLEEGQPVDVMQFTGLKDKNGVEIYEGDILQHPDGSTFCVVWNAGHSGFRAEYTGDDGGLTGMISLQVGDKGLAKVVGNIHQNPDLLNEQETAP
jgi:hypothetical protein